MWDYDIGKARQREETTQLQERFAQRDVLTQKDETQRLDNRSWQKGSLEPKVIENKEVIDFEKLIKREAIARAEAKSPTLEKDMARSLEREEVVRDLNARLSAQKGQVQQLEARLLTQKDQIRQLDAQAVLDKVQTSREQAKWLEDGAQKLRTQGEFLTKPGETMDNTRPVASRALIAGQEEKQTSEKSSMAVNIAPRKAEIETMTLKQTKIIQTSLKVPEETFADVFKRGGGGSESGKGAIKENSTSLANGTQSAPRDPNAMSYFATYSDSKNDHSKSWQQRLDDESDDLAMNGMLRGRQGAIVEAQTPNQYRQVLLEQTLMPRLLELVQRLSAMGYSWARVVVPVDAQTKIIVRFNTQNGRVKIHLSVPEDDFCQVIRNGWSALCGHLAQNGITLEEPTFDTNTYEQ